MFTDTSNTLRRRFLVAVLCISALNGCSASAASCAAPLTRGVNIAGPAFAPEILPGRLNWHYKFPSVSQLEYYKAVGFDSIRLSILWERTQPELFGPLDEAYVTEIRKTLSQANDVGLRVLLEIHNYARYRGQVVGTEAVPANALFDIWAKLAAAVKDQPALVAYGLMNEPYNTNGLWEVVAQRAVDGVRSVDMQREVLVPGDSFSSTSRWPQTHLKPFVTDPAGKEVYEGHIYFDNNSSGKYVNLEPYAPPSVTVGPKLAPFIDWLNRFEKKGSITEWGVPTRDADWFDTARELLRVTQANCLPSYVWAGGGWSPNYVMSLEPQDGQDKPLIGFFREQFGIGASQ